MSKHIILGVHVSDRVKEIPSVQSLLTEFGCYIKTRLGLHQVDESKCSTKGILILQMFGDESKCFELKSRLNALEGVTVQDMVFEE